MTVQPPSHVGIAAWWLPMWIAVVLVVAAHAALAVSIHVGHVPACVPYIEGCTSISRAARYGLANHVFRLLVLPTAAAIAYHWWLAGRWLALHGPRAPGMVAAGLVAALALAVYATFLGTEGEVYRALRRHGVIVFFGAGFLAQLLCLRAMGKGVGIDRRAYGALRAICLAMLALGVVHVVALAAIGGSALQDRLENALEWHIGALLVAWYVATAVAWRRDGWGLVATWREPKDAQARPIRR